MPEGSDGGLQKRESNGEGTTCTCCEEEICKEGSTVPRRCKNWFIAYGAFKSNACGCIVVAARNKPERSLASSSQQLQKETHGEKIFHS